MRDDAEQPRNTCHVLDFDKHRETLLEADMEEGWAPELRRYLCSVHRDVTKHTDLVEWWQVSSRIWLSVSLWGLTHVNPSTFNRS